MPSQRDALILFRHHATSSGVGPQASLGRNSLGDQGMVENGCVGQLCSPGISTAEQAALPPEATERQ